MKRALTVALLAWSAGAQGLQHAAWSIEPVTAAARPGGKALLRATAKIDAGWHLYSASSPAGIPATFQVRGPVEKARVLQPPPKQAFDQNFNSDTETYEGEVVFLLELRLNKDAPAGPQAFPVNIRYQTCSDRQCVPGKWSGTATLNVDPSAAEAAVIPAGYAEAKAPSGTSPGQGTQSEGWAGFLLVAFGFGLASIFTPCVFPMIPITMSYFSGKRGGVGQAVLFCAGIVVLFSTLGLVTTAALGPVGVKQLGSNPWVNGFIAALFIAFGLSLLGAFELTVPSSVLTRLNKSADKGGFAGTLLMGLAFSLSSFACVGPFVGTLLAASVGGGGWRPLAGMLTFATGLALPFFLLALFPSYLQRMPRSGGWLARVKVVMGFVILAFSLKYLSSLDQVAQWGFLTRERFLAAWVVLFAMAGLYLLGYVRLEGVKPDERLGLGRLLVGMVFLIFAASLLPGMFGGRLGDLDAYVPAAQETAGGAAAPQNELVWIKDQYPEALAKARREGKLVFIDFTGYACANCHWMRANMLSKPEIAALLKNFVLLELYCDGADAASQANAKLELDKFGTVAQPLYVILDPDEKTIATFDHLTRDPQEFLAFLAKGTSAPAETQAAKPAGNAPADPLPRLTKVEGGDLNTGALAGKVVVVNFWATWCVPCIQEIPGFNQLHNELGSKGVAVLGVDLDQEDAPERVKAFLKKHTIQYALGIGSEETWTQYKLESLPVTLVFDRTGKQVKRFEGSLKEDELRKAVQEAL